MSPTAAEARVKRLRMRAWRRGTKEMDLILGLHAEERLAGMDAGALDRFEALLDQADDDLYHWIVRRDAPPPDHAAMVEEVRGSAERRFRASGSDAARIRKRPA